MNQYTKQIQKLSEEVKSENFCYLKAERAITEQQRKAAMLVNLTFG